MGMCDAIVRTAGMVNLQSSTEMIESLSQSSNNKDCRPKFIFAAGQTILDGNDGFHNFDLPLGGALPIHAPFLNFSKAGIARKAIKLDVPLHMTWSCYKGGDKHCGRCGTCVERLEAIQAAVSLHFAETGIRIKDETEYEDTEFWRVAVREANRRA